MGNRKAIFHVVLAGSCAVLLILFVCWFIKRRLIDRKPTPPGVSNAARTNLLDMMNKEQRAAVEHQMFMEEEDYGGAMDFIRNGVNDFEDFPPEEQEQFIRAVEFAISKSKNNPSLREDLDRIRTKLLQ